MRFNSPPWPLVRVKEVGFEAMEGRQLDIVHWTSAMGGRGTPGR